MQLKASKRRLRYCPACAGTLTQNRRPPLICKQCGFHFYYDPHVSAAVILRDTKNRILLLKRKSNPKKGFWHLPGGFIEINESAEDALRREVKEEIGAHMENVRYLGSFTNRYFDGGINYHTITIFFTADIKRMRFTRNDETDTIAFFAPKDIPFAAIAFGGVRQALMQFRKEQN